MSRRLIVFIVITIPFFLTSFSHTASAPCVSADMTITASFPNDAGFEGLWKYTISGSWDLGGGSNALSHISFLFALDCVCACDISGLVQFDTPAGTSTGTDSLGNDCTFEYGGLFECEGDPTIVSDLPAVKFEGPEGQNCETGATGTGTWSFYSILSPLPNDVYPDAVVIKYGNNECTGNLSGQLPNCEDCLTIPVEQKSWGAVKKDYE